MRPSRAAGHHWARTCTHVADRGGSVGGNSGFSGAAPQNALRDLAPEFERATGDRVEFTFRIVSEIQEKLAAGEKADLILLPAPLIAATEKTVPLRSEGQNCPGPRWHRSHHAAGYNAAGYLDGRSRAQDVT
jgi:hypothetical protein